MKIQIKSISKKYDDKIILKNLSYELDSNKRYAIIGANGAGKSSLLKIIAGIDTDYSGNVVYDDDDINDLSTSQKAKIISYMKQNQSDNIYYTVYELLLNARYVYTSLFNKYSQNDYNAIDYAMKITNTSQLADADINELSGGQVQRVWLAFAIAQQSKWLMIDEPASFLDIKYQKEMMEVLNKIENTGIVCVMHDINFASLYFDKIIALKDGEIIYQGNAKQIINNKIIQDIFAINVDIVKHPKLNANISLFY